MNSVSTLSRILALSSAALLAAGFYLAGAAAAALAPAAAAGLWLAGGYFNWKLLTPAAFSLLVISAAAGFPVNAPSLPLLLSVAGALSAWDLDRFARRMRSAGRGQSFTSHSQQTGLENRHLKRLFLVNGFGLILAVLALQVELQLSFALAFILALSGVLCLSRGLARLINNP